MKRKLTDDNGPAVLYRDEWNSDSKLTDDNGPAVIQTQGCKLIRIF